MAPFYHIGTSGWHYKHWRGLFFPEKLSAFRWLEYYSNHFNTVEINYSFYRLPLESTFTKWYQMVPSEFCFSLKTSRYITHIRRLQNAKEPLSTFANRARYLQNKLGPFLYQLPPNFHQDNERLEAFLISLDKNLKHVFEFRHHSWMEESVFNLLRKYDIAFCIFDMPGFSSPLQVTADFVYIRLHGKGELYGGSYPDADLSRWAEKIDKLSGAKKEIYVYFNNDASANAVQNALTLKKYLGGKSTSP
jgi:uncharacterized protein YecE (DUF72 family)